MSDGEGIAGGSVGGEQSSSGGGDYRSNLDQSVSNVIQHQAGGDEKQEMADFVAESRYQEAKKRGDDVDDKTRNERSERLKRALEGARAENAALNGETAPESYQPQDYAQPSEEDRAAQQRAYEDDLRSQGANKVRYEQLRETHSEFIERANINYDVIPMSPQAFSMVKGCDNPMDVAVWVGSDPDAIAELNAMAIENPRAAKKIVDQLDARVAIARSMPQQQQQFHARRQTGAPPPLSTPRGGSSAPVSDRTGPDDMGAFAKWLGQKMANKSNKR